MRSEQDRQRPTLQRAILSLLQEERPSEECSLQEVEAALKRYECGGYLHHLWSGNGRSGTLPAVWAEAMARIHRKCFVDNLVALSELRAVGRYFVEEGIPFVLLKGADYLIDLYDDPGARMLTDIDLLVRRSDVGRLARRLAAAGFRGEVNRDFPEGRRFEMMRPGPGGCRFEIHWWLGRPTRLRADHEGLWKRSRRVTLEGIPCGRLAPEDALLYHVAHLAEHYFGPSLKWAIDLREMFRRWGADSDVLVSRSTEWGNRAALCLALRHLAKLFPGDARPELAERLAPGPLRRHLLRPFLSSSPVELIEVATSEGWSSPLRLLLIDRPVDAIVDGLRVLARPLARPIWRARGWSAPPWEWLD